MESCARVLFYVLLYNETMQKIAVAIVHGVGKQDPGFADGMMQNLAHHFTAMLGMDASEAAKCLSIKPIYWAPVLQKREDSLLDQVKKGGRLDWTFPRQIMIDYGADAVAYQQMPKDRTIYDEIHAVVAGGLKELSREAGENAPLCVIAHSLGTIIASNFFYDLQAEFALGKKVLPFSLKTATENTPLERGETLALFYTMGSPIAVWSLRYENFGIPIAVPSFDLERHYPPKDYPELSGEWINFYDRDDVAGYPLKTLNTTYATTVTEDMEINAGGIATGWNPASHLSYWTDSDVVGPIATGLSKVFRAVNR